MPNPTIIAVGELLVEFVSHQKGCELRALSEYSGPYPSGAPAICIDQAARMGASTQIYGSIGQDNFGHSLIERLQSHGVNTSGIASVAHKTTGVAFVSYFVDGSRTFIFHLNSTAADAVDAASIQLPQEPVIMHISGSSLGNANLRGAIATVASEVIERGGQISCDPNARPELMSDPEISKVLTGLIEQCSYLFPSDTDLEFLYPALSPDERIARLFELGVETIALTQGEMGSTLFNKGSEPLYIAGYRVDEVDPTGAGDCYCGTFLAMLAEGHPIETCGQYANAAGALAVTQRGPMEGNSDLTTIEAFMKTTSANVDH